MASVKPAVTLGEAWLEAIQDGRLSVADACDWSRLRTQDPGADGIIVALSRCGGSHAERDLHRWVQEQPWRRALPMPYGFEAPVATKEGGAVMKTLSCLLPHEVFSTLWAQAPLTFVELFGDEVERAHYWAEMDRVGEEMKEDNPHRAREHRHWLRRLPARGALPKHRVPLGMHGDGGQMHGGECITAMSWGGLVRKGSTADTRLLFMVLKDSEMLEGKVTSQKALEVFVWSLTALARGVHPEADHTGRPFGPAHHPERAALAGKELAPVRTPGASTFEGKLCGAWCEIRGDWPYLAAALGLKYNFNGKDGRLCHLCDASKDGPNAIGEHFADSSALRGTLVGPFHHGPGAWVATTPISPLTKAPGFSIWRCMFDLMHTLDLGLYQRVIPAALQGLMGEPAGANRRARGEEASLWPGASRAARCKAATAAYLKWAGENSVPHSSRVKRITARWVKGQYPDISTEHAKAAATRAMAPWVAEVARARSSEEGAGNSRVPALEGARNSRVPALRATLLTELVAMDRVYTGQPRFLSRQQQRKATQHCLAALQALKALAELQPEGPWKLVPKAHALQHIVLDSGMQNPRVQHCYQDEDFVGRMKRTYTACHGATAPHRAIQRYAMGTSLRLAAREEALQGKRAARALPQPAGGPLRGTGGGRAAASSGATSTAGARRPRAKAGPKTRGRPRKTGPKRAWGRPKSSRGDRR